MTTPIPTATPAAVDTSLVVSEVFGPTFQGEGRSLGRRAAFVRLGGCNLSCSWCDTPYTWDATRYDLRAELNRRPVDSILDQVRGMAPDVVVLTGGEPLLQQRQTTAWARLLDGLRPFHVEVETNGTQRPTVLSRERVDLFTVSPKLAHGGDPLDRRIVPDALVAFAELAWAGRAVLKVVCKTPLDVVKAASYADQFGWPRSSTYVMPEGVTPADVIAGQRDLAQATLDAGLCMTTRLHTLIWGQERAR